MKTWTAVTPSNHTLPTELGLLVAPVRIAGEPSTIEGSVGHAEGVVLDEEGRVAGFLVRLSPTLVAGGPRTLVPASAFSIGQESSLLLAWPQDKLLAQRRLDDDLQHFTPAAGAAPGEGKIHVNETIKEGFEGSAVGAVVGGILGGIAGGPVLAFALAAFFATGGGLVGFIAGGGQETREQPAGAKPEVLGSQPASSTFSRLQDLLRDPALAAGALVHFTPFAPRATIDGPARPAMVARAH